MSTKVNTTEIHDRAGRKLRVRIAAVRVALAALILALVAIPVRRDWQAARLRGLFLPELRDEARHQPMNGSLQALLGLREAQALHYDVAASRFEQAIADGENDEMVWRTWAASLAAAGKREQCWAVLQIGMADPSRALTMRAASERAKALPAAARSGDLAAAIAPEGFRRMLARYAGASWATHIMDRIASCHPETMGFAAREEYAKRAPQNETAQRLWGEALVRNERFIEADQVLEHALALKDDPETRLALGDALAGQGATAKAGREYLACLKARRDWVPALQGLGRVALDKQLVSMSLEIYQKLVRLAPQDPDSWIGLGRAWYIQKLNLKGSLDAFRKAVQLAPGRTDFYNDYSNSLRVNFRMEEAEQVLRSRLAIVPEDAHTHYLLALLLLEHNPTVAREKEAEAEFRDCLRREPTAISARSRLGRLLVHQGRGAEAIPLLQASLTEDRYDIAAASALARAYRMAGRDSEAARMDASVKQLSAYVQNTSFLEDQLRRSPLDIKLHRQLAALYERGGQRETAQLHLQTAYLLERHPEQAARGFKELLQSTTATGPVMSADPAAGHSER